MLGRIVAFGKRVRHFACLRMGEEETVFKRQSATIILRRIRRDSFFGWILFFQIDWHMDSHFGLLGRIEILELELVRDGEKIGQRSFGEMMTTTCK